MSTFECYPQFISTISGRSKSENILKILFFLDTYESFSWGTSYRSWKRSIS